MCSTVCTTFFFLFICSFLILLLYLILFLTFSCSLLHLHFHISHYHLILELFPTFSQSLSISLLTYPFHNSSPSNLVAISRITLSTFRYILIFPDFPSHLPKPYLCLFCKAPIVFLSLTLSLSKTSKHHQSSVRIVPKLSLTYSPHLLNFW